MKRLPKSPTTILAIDPGKQSGWAIYSAGALQASGTAKNASDRLQAIQDFMQFAGPRFVLKEKVVFARNFMTALGLGVAWGSWKQSLELAGHPMAKIASVSPPDWRKVVFGTTRLKREDAKKRALRYCEDWYGPNPFRTEDEAEAICIGAYALKEFSLAD